MSQERQPLLGSTSTTTSAQYGATAIDDDDLSSSASTHPLNEPFDLHRVLDTQSDPPRSVGGRASSGDQHQEGLIGYEERRWVVLGWTGVILGTVGIGHVISSWMPRVRDQLLFTQVALERATHVRKSV
jgi:hypothetical protein